MSDRKHYTADFKRDAVRLMTKGKQSWSEVSRTLGVKVSLLGKWKRQLTLAEEVQATGRSGYAAFPGGYAAFPGQGRAHDEAFPGGVVPVVASKPRIHVLATDSRPIYRVANNLLERRFTWSAVLRGAPFYAAGSGAS